MVETSGWRRHHWYLLTKGLSEAEMTAGGIFGGLGLFSSRGTRMHTAGVGIYKKTKKHHYIPDIIPHLACRNYILLLYGLGTDAYWG